MVNVNNENPTEHWGFVNVTGKTVLDLGCGRWEKMEKRDPNWLTTPEYFVSKGAKKVVAVDIDSVEIDWFNKQYAQSDSYTFLLKSINSIDDIKNMIQQYKPECVKCDIESGEKYLFALDSETFNSVEEYYIETHGNFLYSQCIETMRKYNYKIIETIDLTHTNGQCKVIFARKQKQ